MKTIISITAAAALALGGILVATPAQAAPHPSPNAYAHASSHAKFKRHPPLTRQFCGPLPVGWPRWAPPLTPCTKPLTHPTFSGNLPADWPSWRATDNEGSRPRRHTAGGSIRVVGTDNLNRWH